MGFFAGIVAPQLVKQATDLRIDLGAKYLLSPVLSGLWAVGCGLWAVGWSDNWIPGGLDRDLHSSSKRDLKWRNFGLHSLISCAKISVA